MLSPCLGNRPLLSSLLRQSYLVIPRHQMFNLWLVYASFSDSSNRSAKHNLYPDYELKISCALVANQTINKHMKQSLSLSQDLCGLDGRHRHLSLPVNHHRQRQLSTTTGYSVHTWKQNVPLNLISPHVEGHMRNAHGNQLSWLLKKWVALVNAPNTTGV